MKRKAYPSDLSDREWRNFEPLIPPSKPGGRPREQDMREILNALFYLVKTGWQWRYLPHDFPSHKTVYNYFREWRESNQFEKFNSVLREDLRVLLDKEPEPSAAIVDSQSVKTEKGGKKDTMVERK